MKRRHMPMFAALIVAIGAALFVPQAAFAGCQITDPGCYIDDFTHKQLYQFDLTIWQYNRAGLVVAHWLEDLRTWLTNSVFADAFTTLIEPVKHLFWLALIVAWLIFVISFMVQSFVDLRWVDLRRAVRPILLAVFVFTFGGSLLKGTEEMRLTGGTLLQQVATDAVRATNVPSMSIGQDYKGDMADASASIYDSSTSCQTPIRSPSAKFLSDYDARYLWANADDIHCSEVTALADEFYTHYFPYGQDISGKDGSTRQDAVAAAAQGGGRQVTGVFMTFGAIVEQIVQLLFAVALAMVWFGILISLVFGIFVPTEELFSSQIKMLLSVLRASWLASFLIGLGLAVLQVVATSGNGLLVFICGLLLIAVSIWQGKQALETMSTALSAVGTATGSAPQAIGGMVGGWAKTAAMVAGVAATGGGVGAMLGSVGSTMVRRAGRSVGDNPLSEAAGRVLSNRVADRLDNYTQDQRIEQDAQLNVAEAAWYERRVDTDTDTPEIAADAREQAESARQRAAEQRAVVLDRQGERARQQRNFAKAGQLRREAAKVRGEAPSMAEDATSARQVEPDIDPTQMDRAMEQLHEAQDDPEMQRRVLVETAALAQRRAQLKAMRNLALREKRSDDAKGTIRDLNALDANEQSAGETRPALAAASDDLTRTAPKMRSMRPQSQAVRELDHEIAALAEQIGRMERDEVIAPTQEARDDATAQLAALRSRLVAAHDQRAAVRPTSPALLAEALIQAGPLAAGKPIAVARTAQGLVASGHAVTDTIPTDDASRVLVTAGGQVTLAAADGAKVLTLPVGQAIRVPTLVAESPSTSMSNADRPVAATGTTVPLTGERVASATNSVPLTGNPVASTTNGMPSLVIPDQTTRTRAGRGMVPGNGQGARLGAVGNGATTPVTSGQAATTRGADVGQQPAVAQSAVAAAPVPNVATSPAVAPLATPVSTPSPVTSTIMTEGAAATIVGTAVAAAPASEASASSTASAVAPAPSAASAVAVVFPAEAPAADPVSVSNTTVSAVPAISTVQSAARSVVGLPLRGAAVPVVADPSAAPTVQVVDGRPALQPARATAGPVLPHIAAVRERPEMTPTMPSVTTNPTKLATTTQQPWKRRKGNK